VTLLESTMMAAPTVSPVQGTTGQTKEQ